MGSIKLHYTPHNIPIIKHRLGDIFWLPGKDGGETTFMKLTNVKFFSLTSCDILLVFFTVRVINKGEFWVFYWGINKTENDGKLSTPYAAT